MRPLFTGAWLAVGILLIASCGSNPDNRQGMGGRQAQGPHQNGKGIGGKVESVEAMTIAISNPEGKNTVVTTEATKFTKNGKASSLADVTDKVFIEVTGKKQEDGSWLATEIAISDTPPQGGPQSGNGPPRK